MCYEDECPYPCRVCGVILAPDNDAPAKPAESRKREREPEAQEPDFVSAADPHEPQEDVDEPEEQEQEQEQEQPESPATTIEQPVSPDVVSPPPIKKARTIEDLEGAVETLNRNVEAVRTMARLASVLQVTEFVPQPHPQAHYTLSSFVNGVFGVRPWEAPETEEDRNAKLATCIDTERMVYVKQLNIAMAAVSRAQA